MSKQPERRRRVVRAFAPAVGLLAAGLLVWQGSYAAFSATTNNTGSTWGAAKLTLENNGGSAGAYNATTTAAFGGSNMKPGDSGSECVTVESLGTAGGNLVLWGALDPSSDATMAAQVSVSVVAAKNVGDITQDCTGFPSTGTTPVITNKALNALPANYAGGTQVMIAAADKVSYKLTWTFNSLGSTTLDNPMQGKTAKADFTWELQ